MTLFSKYSCDPLSSKYRLEGHYQLTTKTDLETVNIVSLMFIGSRDVDARLK